MEGYSVTEAASVLGVPTERVWELLARGVLSGAAEGETGMRVFLQPRPAPAPIDEARAGNGRGSDRPPEVESSPFRELLTEFRNLTERYGQALLALGEARGEVASLRSRVDLLEARFDLRLPMSPPLPQRSAVVEPAPPDTGESTGAASEVEPDEQPRRKRGRGHRRATDEFAEALARAEDPTPAELPGARDAAAAYAAFRDETPSAVDRGPTDTDAALPRELPAAEPIATFEPDAAPQPAEVRGWSEPSPEPPGEAVPQRADDATAPAQVDAALVEPAADMPATEDTQDIAATPPPVAEVEAEAALVAAAEISPPEVPIEPVPSPASEPEPEPELELGPETGWAAEGEAEPTSVPDAAEPEWTPARDEAVAAEPEPVESEPVSDDVERAEPPTSWDRGRYSTAIEEPDWIPEEREPIEWPAEPAAQPALATTPARSEPEAFGWDREETTVWFGSGGTTPEADDEPIDDEPPADEEPVDAGAAPGSDAPEPEAPSPAAGPPPSPAAAEASTDVEPGEPLASAEDDPASEMEVAGASGHAPAVTITEPAEPPGTAPSTPPAPWAPAPSPPPPWAARPVDPMPPGTSVQVTSGPASRAYRRLRRIFPG